MSKASATRAAVGLLATALALVCSSALAGWDDVYVLPPDAERVFQAVIHDVNDRHELGDSISVTDVRIEQGTVGVSLSDARSSRTLDLRLVHPGETSQRWARYFAYRAPPVAPDPVFTQAIARLGSLLDGRFSADPWLLVGAPIRADGPTVRPARRRGFASLAMVGALSLLSLVVLTVASPKD